MPSGSESRSRKGTASGSPPSQPSSGNVFADLDLPNPDLALAKAELVQRIRDLILDRKITQVRAAQLLGLDQPKVSSLVRGSAAGYSLDRLFRFLNALGQRVEIKVGPTKARGNLKGQRGILVS